MMKTALYRLAVAALLVAAAGRAPGQDLPSVSRTAAAKDLPLQSALRRAEQTAAAKSWSTEGLRAELAAAGLRMDADRMVHVTISGPEGREAVPASFVTSRGGKDDTAWRNARDAWVPVDRLGELARALPQGYFLGRVDPPQPCDVVGEGPAAVNADSYRDGGADGAGMTLAVIDFGFDGLTEAWNNGDIPSPYTWHNHTPSPLESVTVHGTGCLEAAFDHCPGASFHLYMIDSSTDVGPALQDAIANGVDVVSMSLSWNNLGWDDNSGVVCAALDDAANHGLIFAVSAGNYAQRHYQGVMNVGGDDLHDFGPGDETIDIVIAANSTVVVTMQWNTAGGTYDYDLYLLDSNLDEITSSTSPDNYYEWVSYTNSSATPQLVHVAVERYSGGNTEFEIYTDSGTWQEHRVPWSSVASPGNATHPNVLTVGAVVWDDFSSPNGTGGIVTDYSSNGPGNSGTILPDICGPTLCTGFTYPDGMSGTSNSAPNVAGAICAFWSADPLLHPSGVCWLVLKQAGMWRDWGGAGPDNVYGWGGMTLHGFHPDTIWIARDYANTANLRSLPLHTVQAANDWAVDGGRLLFLGGGDYPEPAVLNRAVSVEHPGGVLILGQ